MTELASLVLFAADLEVSACFYGAGGVPLEGEGHDEGPVQLAAELGGVHFALYAATGAGRAPERRSAGATFAGLYVESLDDVLRDVTAVGAPLLSGHEVMPWGCRFVVEDPDGRAVEVNDADH